MNLWPFVRKFGEYILWQLIQIPVPSSEVERYFVIPLQQ